MNLPIHSDVDVSYLAVHLHFCVLLNLNLNLSLCYQRSRTTVHFSVDGLLSKMQQVQDIVIYRMMSFDNLIKKVSITPIVMNYIKE